MLKIGEQEGEAAYLFDRIAGIRLLPTGGLVVADRGSATVRVFAENGSHLVSMGGPGEGPGEFSYLGQVILRPPDTILVYDGGLLRITRYLTDGTLVGTQQIEPGDGIPELYLGSYSNGDAAIAWIVPTPRDLEVAAPDLMKIGRFGADGSLVAVLGTVSGMRRLGPGPVPFSPFLHAFVLRDSVVYTDGAEPALYMMDGGETPHRSIPVTIPRPNVDEAWKALEVRAAELGISQRLAAFPSNARVEPIPAIAEVLVDGEGLFWLKHYDPGTDSYLVRGGAHFHGGRWTVVSSSGRVVAEVGMPDGFAPLDISGDRIAGVHVDDLGVERVWVLGLQRH